MWIAIIHLPQRFQLVYHDNPIMAGVHLLPMLSAIAFGKLASPFDTSMLTILFKGVESAVLFLGKRT